MARPKVASEVLLCQMQIQPNTSGAALVPRLLFFFYFLQKSNYWLLTNSSNILKLALYMGQALEGTTDASMVYGSIQILPLNSVHGASGSLLQSETASIQHSSGSGLVSLELANDEEREEN